MIALHPGPHRSNGRPGRHDFAELFGGAGLRVRHAVRVLGGLLGGGPAQLRGGLVTVDRQAIRVHGFVGRRERRRVHLHGVETFQFPGQFVAALLQSVEERLVLGGDLAGGLLEFRDGVVHRLQVGLEAADGCGQPVVVGVLFGDEIRNRCVHGDILGLKWPRIDRGAAALVRWAGIRCQPGIFR